MSAIQRDLRKFARPYGLAFVLAPGLTLATLWIRQTFVSRPNDSPAFITFMVPVFLSAYLGGLGAGLVATVLSAACVDYFVLPPTGSWTIERGFDQLNLLVFIGVSLAASAASERLHHVHRDAQASRLLAASLAHAAEHDSLTDLPNRRLLTARLQHAIALTQRNGSVGAVLFLDLDDFKDVNNALGHAAGDELLVAVAGRLRRDLRQIDTAARFGGDEFVVLLEGIAGPGAAATVAQMLIARLAEPVVLAGGHEVAIGVSIGISMFPTDARDVDSAMRNADAALYRAKAVGRATYRFHDEAQARALGTKTAPNPHEHLRESLNTFAYPPDETTESGPGR